MTKWEMLRRHVNDQKIGGQITRRQVQQMFYGNEKPTRWALWSSTMDQYIVILRKLGVLSLKDRGIYKVHHHIRETAAIRNLREMAYGHSFRCWFHDIFA
jgi:hypothetical protein